MAKKSLPGWFGFVLSHWLLGSLFLGVLALAIDGGLLAAASGNVSPGRLVNDGSVIAGGLGIAIQWLLVCWTAISTQAWRKAALVANAMVIGALVIAYASLRVDVLLVNEVVFQPNVVRFVTVSSAVLVGAVSLVSAVITEADQP